MIRNIMGCLIAVGSGKQPVSWMQSVLNARSRDAAAPTFSQTGCIFWARSTMRSGSFPESTPPFAWLP